MKWTVVLGKAESQHMMDMSDSETYLVCAELDVRWCSVSGKHGHSASPPWVAWRGFKSVGVHVFTRVTERMCSPEQPGSIVTALNMPFPVFLEKNLTFLMSKRGVKRVAS